MFLKLARRLLGRSSTPPNLNIGANVHIGQPCWLDWSHGRHITIEDNVTLAPGVRILCHDASSNRRLGITWVAPVRICRGAFIGAQALLLPGVTIGEGAIVAAGAVVSHSVPPGMVVAGIPAKAIMTVAELDAKREAGRSAFKTFQSSDYERDDLSQALNKELQEAAERDGGYYLC